jgi:pyruvate kinase
MTTELRFQRAKTKIVATVGPASRSNERLAELVAAGVDVFRINLAHAGLAEHEETVARIRGVAAAAKRPIAILADLSGPKIRLDELPGGKIELAAGENCRFVRGEPRGERELSTNYDTLLDELNTGDSVMLVDGTVSLVVEKVDKDTATCRVLQGGVVRSRQGVNLPGVKLRVSALGESDREHAVWAARQDLDFVGLSFVRSASDVGQLRDLVEPVNSQVQIVAKIEKREALDDLEAIIKAADAVMVARGDLGVEIDVAQIAIAQKRIIAACHAFGRPVITATQMLDSMQHASRPTRAEATDVANAVLDGADACMLSGETAIGEYPVESVAMMNRIMLATESWLESMTRGETGGSVAGGTGGVMPITSAVVHGASRLAVELSARMVFVASHSGRTALALAKQRSFVPTVGVSDVPAVLRKMCLYWGVIPLAEAPAADRQRLIAFLGEWGRRDELLAKGDRVVIIAGNDLAPGAHNVIEVHEVS